MSATPAARRVYVADRMASLPAAARADGPTRRRAGVFRRALRHEVNRIRDPRRLLMMVILGSVGGFVLALDYQGCMCPSPEAIAVCDPAVLPLAVTPPAAAPAPVPEPTTASAAV